MGQIGHIQHIPENVIVVGVTKKQPLQNIEEGIKSGLTHIGENYVDEAREKIALIKRLHPEVVFHMIGHVQSRKSADVVELFDWVDSVDSVDLAKKLSDHAREHGNVLNILLEVNLSGEATKLGFDLAGWEKPIVEGEVRTGQISKFNSFMAAIREIAAMPNLLISGIMVMPPVVANPEDNRLIFASAKQLFEEVGKVVVSPDWKHISMGTSQDYEVAITEGATMVRLGEALFGPRPV